jgi:hypothetical protein
MRTRLDIIRASIIRLVDNMLTPAVKGSQGTVAEEDVTNAYEALLAASSHLTNAINRLAEDYNKLKELEDE